MVAVHELAEEHAALRARLLALDEQSIEQPLLLPRNLLRGIRRVLEQVGDDLDEQLPLIAHDRAAQAARVARDLAARGLEQVRDVFFGVALRALVDEAARQERRAFESFRIERRPAADVRLHREHGRARAARDEEHAAALEREALDRQLELGQRTLGRAG